MRWQLVVIATIIILLTSQIPICNGQAEIPPHEDTTLSSGSSIGSMAKAIRMAARASVEFSDDGIRGLSSYVLRNGGTKADDLVRALGSNADDVLRISSKSATQLGDDALLAIERFVAEGKITASWSDDALKGLGDVLSRNLDDASKIFAGYSDDVAEATFKGVGKGVINPREVDIDTLAKAIDDYAIKTERNLVDDIVSLENDIGDDATRMSNNIMKGKFINSEGGDATTDIFERIARASRDVPVDIDDLVDGKSLSQMLDERGLSLKQWNIYNSAPRDAIPENILSKIDDIVVTVKNSQPDMDLVKFVNSLDEPPMSFVTRQADVAGQSATQVAETLQMPYENTVWKVEFKANSQSCDIPVNKNWPCTNTGVTTGEGRTAFEYTLSNTDGILFDGGVYARAYSRLPNGAWSGTPSHGLLRTQAGWKWVPWDEIP